MSSATVSIIVSSQNDFPVITQIPDQIIEEDKSAGPIAVSLRDIETVPDSIDLKVSSSNPGLFPESGISLAGSGANRTLFLTPVAHQFGSSLISVTAIDGDNASTSIDFKITVNPVNDEPTADGQTAVRPEGN